MHPSSWKPGPLTLGPLETLRTVTSTSTRCRRPRKVLYPACQSRRAPLKEPPDPAHRWLLLLSVLVFLQIYSEDALTCTELQSSSSKSTTCGPQETDGGPGDARRDPQESWRSQAVGPEHQMECVVA